MMNVANKNMIPSATKPYVRLTGFISHLPDEPASSDCFVRLVPQSSKDQIVWTTVGADKTSAEEHVDAWNTYRSLVHNEVLQAARTRTMRSVYAVRASALLQEAATDKKIVATKCDGYEAAGASAAGSSITCGPKPNLVRELRLDEEIRGQKHAIVAVCGDAHVTQQREALMYNLGKTYFRAVYDATHRTWPEDSLYHDDFHSAEAEYFSLPDDTRKHYHNQIMTAADKVLTDIADLVPQPSIAVFDYADEVDTLIKKTGEMAQWPELMHADIAVVRMYSWIAVDKAYGAKRICRNPEAQIVMDAIRAAQKA